MNGKIPNAKKRIIQELINTKRFKTDELVCSHILSKFAKDTEDCWSELSYGLISTLITLTKKFPNNGIIVNNYGSGGGNSQRGARCPKCELMKDGSRSKHWSDAIDFNINGKSNKEIYNYILNNQADFPYVFRIEALDDQNRVHIDCDGGLRREDGETIYVFQG